MSTTPPSPPLSRMDVITMWVSYFGTKYLFDQDKRSLGHNDHGYTLEDKKNLLEHVQYLEEIIAAQSRKVFRELLTLTTKKKYMWRKLTHFTRRRRELNKKRVIFLELMYLMPTESLRRKFKIW